MWSFLWFFWSLGNNLLISLISKFNFCLMNWFQKYSTFWYFSLLNYFHGILLTMIWLVDEHIKPDHDFFWIIKYVKGSSDEFINANIQLALAVVRKLQDKRQLSARIVREFVFFCQKISSYFVLNFCCIALLSGVSRQARKASSLSAFQDSSWLSNNKSHLWLLICNMFLCNFYSFYLNKYTILMMINNMARHLAPLASSGVNSSWWPLRIESERWLVESEAFLHFSGTNI